MDALVHAAIRKTSTVDVIPATPKLTALESVLPSATCREQLLQYILSFIKEEYDYIFLDCHPGSALLTQNALTASTSVILPVEAHVLSSDGLAQEEKMIRSVRRHLNPDLQIEGILSTRPIAAARSYSPSWITTATVSASLMSRSNTSSRWRRRPPLVYPCTNTHRNARRRKPMPALQRR